MTESETQSRWPLILSIAVTAGILIMGYFLLRVGNGTAVETPGRGSTSLDQLRRSVNNLQERLNTIVTTVDELQTRITEIQSGGEPAAKSSSGGAKSEAPKKGAASGDASSSSASKKPKKPAATAPASPSHPPPTIKRDVYAGPLSQAERARVDKCMRDKRGLKRDDTEFLGEAGMQGAIRHEHVALNPGDVVIDLGGNQGADEDILLERYQPRLYIFEPNPHLCSRLRDKYKDRADQVTVNCNGVSGVTRLATFSLVRDPKHDQADAGEFDPKFHQGEHNFDRVRVYIKSVADALREVSLQESQVAALRLDCQGCEYEVLESVTGSGLAAQLAEIQVRWNADLVDISQIQARRCRLRTLLLRTHVPVYSFYYGWDLWVRKDLAPTTPAP